MKKFSYLLFLSVFLWNCTSNTIIKKPKDLIPKDKMVDLLTDMLLASGAKNIRNENNKRDVNYFPLVFEKYHIDSTQFKESNYYYTSKIDDYNDILSKVGDKLNKMQSEITKQPYNPAIVQPRPPDYEDE